MNTGKLLVGVLAGVAAGAALGILFAPDKGKNTRKKIVKKGEDFAGDLKGSFDEFLDTVKVKFEGITEEVSDITDKLKSKVTQVKKQAENSGV